MDVIVINLAAATERMAFQKAQLDALGLPHERLAAIDAESAPGMKPDAYWNTWERPLKNVEKACLMSHRAAWAKVAASGKPALVLEDDAVLSVKAPALLDELARTKGIDLLTLEVRGRKKLVARDKSGSLAKLPIRRLYQDRTGAAAYVLWPSGAAKLLKRTEDKAGLADAVICVAYELQAYQADPALALQLDRCARYGIPEPIATRSSIDAPKPPLAPAGGSGASPPLAFRIRRIWAQVRMGLRQLAKAPVAVRRDIVLDPADFDFLKTLRRGS